MSSSRRQVPARLAWVVDLLDVTPGDRILEVGCGPGMAIALVAAQLDGGQITAIDRSATAIGRARPRNAGEVAAGRVELQQGDLAGLRAEPATFDKAFAVNVNVFWTSEADRECAVLAEVLRPGGVVRLVFAGPGPRQARDVGPGIASKLAGHGFATEVVHSPDGAMVCVSGRLSETGV
jgi:SAM-dependent methyltransferase